MRFQLTKHNIKQVQEALKDVKSKSVFIGDVGLYGVQSITISEEEVCDCEPDPAIGDDGGRRELIKITFNFKEGKAVKSFCPDDEVCVISFDTDDLWVIEIKDLKAFVKSEMFDLQFNLDWESQHGKL